MIKRTICLWMILLLSLLPGSAFEEAKNSSSSHYDLSHLRLEVQRLKDTYHTEYLGWDSEDRSVFERIGEAAREAPEMIDALIDLCEVKRRPSGITERYTPGTLTPSSAELTGLGAVARPRIETALMKKNLTLWQRAVLEETLYSVALKEADSKGLPRPGEYKHRILQLTDFDNVPAQDTGTLLANPPESINSQAPFQPKSPSEITAPEPQPATPPQAQLPLQTQPISHQPAPVAAPSAASRFPWGVTAAVAAAVLAVSVAWIGIKKRK